MIIIFDYDAGVFDDESLAIRPATPSPKVVVQIPNVKKNISAKLNFKILVGNRGSSNVFHVFEEIFMLPKFSIEERRLIITFFSAMRLAPCERLMLMIAGNSCGVRPTASASENRKESRTGRARKTLMQKIAITRTRVISIRK